MKPKFEISLFEKAWKLFHTLDDKIKEKIINNIDKARFFNGPELLKSLTMKYGSLDPNIPDCNINCLHSETKTSGQTKFLIFLAHKKSLCKLIVYKGF